MSVRSLLDTAFAQPQVPGSRVGGTDFVPLESGAWKEFLFGPGVGPGRTGSWDRQMAVLWKRVVSECGVAQQLASKHNIDWDQAPHESKAVLALAGPDNVVVDVAAASLTSQRERWELERRFARIHRRLPMDLSGLVPADVGALRSGLLEERDFRTSTYQLERDRVGRWVRALSGTAAYLAAAHMVPAPLSLDVVTTAPLDEQTRAALRLPAPWSLITHDAVPLRAAEADDDELAALVEAGVCIGPEPVILGGLLAAQPDGRLDPTSGFLLISALDARGKRYWMLQPATYGDDHAGGRVLYGYAAQLAFARWTPPPVLPAPGPRPHSRSALGRIAASEAGRSGGFHGVRVLDFTPPPEDPPEERTAPAGARRPLEFGTWRRAHWKPGVRIGIRDSEGRLVGPVYKDGAVEGTTFTRERRFFPRTRIRRDLPLAPTTTVYELSNSTATPGR
ncbi:hypothetical protein JS756_16080 [Streptomyces actuosus]|uniref:Uncharacterized protein n=1 Tax=Streptomyces actuosus TaxID=1885 RepID=A0ABS2VR55_STRAS|nr:hypothetical protein [Streptomyces actuosus]MBN0045598.1 hypothetical protein [Streptomyces actuosus]